MLQVKTLLKPSTIPNIGYGLFAAQPIKKGDIIWQFNPIVDKKIMPHELYHLTELELEFINKYAFKEEGFYILCTDDGRFINHSKEKLNVEDIIHPVFGSISRAARDIEEGEELFCDYTSFDEDSKNGVDF